MKNPPFVFTLDARLRDYAFLKTTVRDVLILGRKRIETEFNRMRLHTGLLINEHIRLNLDRTEHGEEAVFKLEKDFDIDHTELNRYAQFARSYPFGGQGRQLRLNLSWKCYRKLMIIKDDKTRWKLTAEAEKKEWPFEKVEARVRYVVGKEKESGPPRLSPVCLGQFYTYKIIRPESIGSKSRELLIDTGFSHRLETSLFPRAHFEAGTIVTSAKTSKGYSFTRVSIPKATTPDDLLYTFRAYVEHVIDGDTLTLEFHMGLGSVHTETLRLNGIDCPELDTPEGQAAKRFVQKELAHCDTVTVKSVRTKKEKWGRYLGDVFYSPRHSGESGNPGTLIYLNQLLLDKGHAVRVHW